MEGLGSGGSLTAITSLLSQNYPNERGKALSARSVGIGIGLCVGMQLGASLFDILGYFGVFFAFSIFSSLSIFLVLVFKESKEGVKSSQARGLSRC